ncbi:AAA family ATPase [Thermoflexus sp.]|uniref:AAA family ATPase n=1 Tax=Thermoflexus sp. TaxID=1969742 RepID=UPI0025D4A66C|nr:AAA family ATPase [Thermoflexus sp.]MDW8180827.1 AAA family ATPase [Anaerolineae bacterium]MCS6962894.1 AAA family ATPase [Thermoflexus sp.]MCS7351372.1 AAA family ATPase [Thermoflexus sp.]MCX7690125.1 AAA family ATPase [Thermoflexus sp.]MDW8183929.1 AAA family ATPase [Anaerolineae bacterium]
MTISYLEIRNFKSIKELRIDCRRVNLFIGPPNTGKSNLLEALGGFSLPYPHDLKPVLIECKPDEVLIRALGVPRRRIFHHSGKGNIGNHLRRLKNTIASQTDDL